MFNSNQRLHISGGIPYIGMALVGCLPSPLKRWYYRRRGATIGNNVSFGLFSFIQSPELYLADDVSIAPFTFIRTRSRCRIGARSRIHAFTAIDSGIFEMGEDSSILEQVVIGGLLTPRSSLVIGSRTKVLAFSVLNPTESIVIEDDVCIGGGSYIFTHGTWQPMLDGFPGTFGDVTIKRGAWLAWRGFVMPNVTIGEEATIGGGAVVTRDVPARTLAVGVPAKPIKHGHEYIRDLSQDEKYAMLSGWFEEYASYLNYIGHRAVFTRKNEEAHIIFPDMQGYAIACGAALPNSGNMVISLTGITAAQRQTLCRENRAWFDIAARECFMTQQPLFKELRAFLSRYGLRFAVVAPAYD